MDRRVFVPWIVAAVALSGGCAQVRRIGGGGGHEEPATAAAPGRGGASGQPAREGKPPLPASPGGLVTDSAARQIKEQLQARGYLADPSPGGELDARTSDALRRFQQHEKLAATGFPDLETLRRLHVDSAHAYRSAPEETRSKH